jgi:hypothetical protein
LQPPYHPAQAPAWSDPHTLLLPLALPPHQLLQPHRTHPLLLLLLLLHPQHYASFCLQSCAAALQPLPLLPLLLLPLLLLPLLLLAAQKTLLAPAEHNPRLHHTTPQLAAAAVHSSHNWQQH